MLGTSFDGRVLSTPEPAGLPVRRAHRNIYKHFFSASSSARQHSRAETPSLNLRGLERGKALSYPSLARDDLAQPKSSPKISGRFAQELI